MCPYEGGRGRQIACHGLRHFIIYVQLRREIRPDKRAPATATNFISFAIVSNHEDVVHSNTITVQHKVNKSQQV